MVSGDQTACAEARDFLGDLETAAVKQAVGRMAAECLPPSVTAEMITAAAERAVKRLANKQAPPAFKIQTPILLILEFVQSEMADRAMIMPGASRLEDRKVQYTAGDILTAYSAFRALVSLAR
jgi:D-amino peptidase